MSRIHDALRGGSRGAAPPTGRRAADADAVLAALGYRAEQPRRRGVLLFGATAGVVLACILAWSDWPASPPAADAPPVVPPTIAQAARASIPPPAPAPITKAAAPAPAVVASAAARDVPAPAPPRASAPARPAPAPSPAVGTAPATTNASEFQLALYYQRSGEFEQALIHYTTVLKRDALNVDAHNNVGILYHEKGLYEDAAREFRRVLAIDPSYVTARLNLSAVYLKLGRPDAAAAEARAVLATDPRHSDALVNLALAQDAAGLGAEAQLSLSRALEIAPHSAAAHYNLAQMYERTGELALAAEHYRLFLQFAGPAQAGYVADVRARLQAAMRGTR